MGDLGMTTNDRKGPRAKSRILGLIMGAILTLVSLEVGYRVLGGLGLLSNAWSPTAERVEAFREHVSSGSRGMFTPKAFVGYSLQGKGVNKEGFSDKDWPLAKTPGVPRIACLGGSTTQDGFRVDRNNSYPSFLSRILSRRFKGDVEVLNFGVNGWTSAESLVNYALVVSRYQPDIVVIHHSVNDVWPRLYPNYQADYTHYRIPWVDADVSGWDITLMQWSRLWAAVRIQDPDLVTIRERVIRRVDRSSGGLLTELPPDTTSGYMGNLRRLCRMVQADGGVPVLMTMPFSSEAGGIELAWLGLLEEGTSQNNEIMRVVAAEESALLADAALTFSSDPESHRGFFIDYVHLRAAGNRVKGLSIADAVHKAELIR